MTPARPTWPPRLLRAALAAAARGWPVFPLFPGSKRPAIPGWQTEATCDPAILAVWWGAAPYIGIPCGPARLLVVDLDSPPSPLHAHGADRHGRDVFAEFGDGAGGSVGPATYTVVTPTGEHRYFSVVPPGLGRTTTGWLGPHVDTRGPGGYVVAAGSVRRVDGRRCYYRATSTSAEPAAAPNWLLAALAPAAGYGDRLPSSPPSLGQAGQPEGSVRRVVTVQTRQVLSAQPGTRNTVLFTAALRLGRLVAAGLLDEDEAAEVLRAASRKHIGVNGFTAIEAERAISNGLRYGQ